VALPDQSGTTTNADAIMAIVGGRNLMKTNPCKRARNLLALF